MLRQPVLAIAALVAAMCSIPAPALAAERTHVVQPGETLSAIARRAGTTVADLARMNGVADPNRILVGQVLRIPDGNAAPTRPPGPPSLGAGSVLAERRLVTYYGNPWSAQMGILGQLSKADLVAALQRRAAQYEAAGGSPVQPAIHLVATVAQAGPGADGLYRARMPHAVVEEYARLAEEHGLLLILDVQPGRAQLLAEVEALRPFLQRPHVHLAIDPEFAMGPGERPGVELGSMDAATINGVVRWLADLVEQHGLPNKVLVVHQFSASMIRGKASIVDDPRVDLVVDMDGFGGQGIKRQHYQWYVRDQRVEYAGIKLFFQQDVDLMTPEEVLSLDPPPDVVIYQ